MSASDERGGGNALAVTLAAVFLGLVLLGICALVLGGTKLRPVSSIATAAPAAPAAPSSR